MEAELKIEPSGRHGVVPVGTYVFDAATRLGVSLDADCGRSGNCDSCVVTMTKGAELLTPLTGAETAQLSASRRRAGERLACQAKIEKAGEISMKTTQKAKPELTEFEQFKKEFSGLPLTEKVKNLLDLESITLSETFSEILNLPYTIGEKIRDGLAEFGFAKEEAERKTKRPPEHTAAEDGDSTVDAVETGEAPKRRGRPKGTVKTAASVNAETKAKPASKAKAVTKTGKVGRPKGSAKTAAPRKPRTPKAEAVIVETPETPNVETTDTN